MAEPIPLPLANGFYISDSLPISAQECVNLYPNVPQTEALTEAQLFGTPGVTLIASSGELLQVNRGSLEFKDQAYFVNGNILYRLNQTFESGVESLDLESLGTIEGNGRVSLAENGVQIMILVPGGKGYIFTVDPDTLVEITDTDFIANGQPQYVVFIDGYFACTTDQT